MGINPGSLRVDRITTFCVIAAVAILQSCCHGGPSSPDRGVWAWHEAGKELHDPCFSSSGSEIAIVRKRHIPDGHEAEMLPRSEADEIWGQIDQDDRFADPEVVIVALQDESVTTVGWGWAPSFSPDDRTVAYSHQVRPASGLRITARTLNGNEIHTFRRDSGETARVAAPETGFLTSPIFSPDGKSLIYSIGDAVNGAWPGGVGIGRVDLASGSTTILYPPTKDFGFYHLIDQVKFVSDRLLALRSRPTTRDGSYMANAYTHELIEVGPPSRTIFTWSTNARRRGGALAYGPSYDGGILVFDASWHRLSGGRAQPEKRQQRKGDSPGLVSPDGRRIAIYRDGAIAILSAMSGVEVWSHPIDGEPQALRWSPDSNHVALVVSRYRNPAGEIFSHDELFVLTPPATALPRLRTLPFWMLLTNGTP